MWTRFFAEQEKQKEKQDKPNKNLPSSPFRLILHDLHGCCGVLVAHELYNYMNFEQDNILQVGEASDGSVNGDADLYINGSERGDDFEISRNPGDVQLGIDLKFLLKHKAVKQYSQVMIAINETQKRFFGDVIEKAGFTLVSDGATSRRTNNKIYVYIYVIPRRGQRKILG